MGRSVWETQINLLLKFLFLGVPTVVQRLRNPLSVQEVAGSIPGSPMVKDLALPQAYIGS